MFDRVHIEPVGRGDWSAAMRFLIAGAERNGLIDARAVTMESMAGSAPNDGTTFFQARTWRKTLGAALVLRNPGKTGFLFFSPLFAVGVDATVMAQVIAAASRAAMEGGLSLVQSLLACDAKADVELLGSAGFERLAELIYMRLDLTKAPPVSPDGQGVAWRSYGQYDEQELAGVIMTTYQGSLDCPRLSGLRRPADVIAGHRASGVFCPASWWIASCDGAPAGCVLMNESSSRDVAEVVYIGVTPAFRGRGLAKIMLHRAVQAASSRGMKALTLAVDSGNSYARRVYEAVGFQSVDRRLAYAMLGRANMA